MEGWVGREGASEEEVEEVTRGLEGLGRLWT